MRDARWACRHLNNWVEGTLLSQGDIEVGDYDLVWNVSFRVDSQFGKWGSVVCGFLQIDYDQVDR